MKYGEAKKVMEKFKIELKDMRKQAKPGDTMPAEVFFLFMDTLMPAFNAIMEETDKVRGEKDGSK